jgi:hypothetical protein
MRQQSESIASEQRHPFVIRQFAIRRPCDSIEELKATLLDECMGESVTIQYSRPSGMLATMFVDVTDGGVVESYGEQKCVDLDAILGH